MWTRSMTFVLCAAVALSAGCKKKEEPAKVIAPASAPAPIAPVAAPAAAPAPVAANVADAPALAFFRAQIEACNAWSVKVGNTKAGEKYFDGTAKDPSRQVKVVERPAPNRIIVQDADGTRLLIDLAHNRITSPKGPRSEMPVRYRSCPEKIFVGSSD